MTPLTIGERIILHLGRYDMVDPDDIYNIPWDLTQDGIASSLRISRAHASIELKKLRIAGKIVEKQTHIKGGKSKRKSYLLTPLGQNSARAIREFADGEGIDITPLLDMKHCDPDKILEPLDEDERDLVGLFCVFRCVVKRDEFPKTKQPVAPVDVSGNVIIADDVKVRLLSAFPDDRVREFHSMAADFWFDRSDPNHQERLYHLIHAGRINEACKLVISQKDEWELDNDDFQDSLSKITDIPDRYTTDVLSIRLNAYLESDDIESAKNMCERLRGTDEYASSLFAMDIALAEGDPGKAMEIAVANGPSVLTDIRRSRALIDLERYSEALGILEGIKSDIVRSGRTDNMDDVYILMSTISLRNGAPEDALRFLNKALGVSKTSSRKKIYQKMSEVYGSMG